MKNGTVWKDVDGNPIQAHGGMILKHDGMFYWYGEHKGADNCKKADGLLHRVDVIGISCYSSPNLIDWKYEELALPAVKDDPASPLHPSKVCERPKVIYCEKTGKFVMWVHLDTADYMWAGVGVAVSDTPVGPFTLIRAKQPNGQDSRDMTIFQDTDGTAYLVHSSNWNRTLHIARLTDDYTDVDGLYVSALVDQTREAPAVWCEKGKYYMVSSGCTGWAPNSALYAMSDYMMGKWKLIDNPCTGKDYRKTFHAQSTYMFSHNGKVWLMLDHWKPENLQESAYSILPVHIDGDYMEIPWVDEFTGE